MIQISNLTEKLISSGPKIRHNTYKDEDFFKVVVLSTKKETSEHYAKFLTNTPAIVTSSTRTYTAPFKNTKIVVYARTPHDSWGHKQATVGVDGLIICIENDEEYEILKEEISLKYKFLDVRVIVTGHHEHIVKRWEQELEAKSIPSSSPLEVVLKEIDEDDKEEYAKILAISKAYDKDNSGQLEMAEMPAIIKSLGQDPDNPAIKEALIVLDVNHDNIIEIDEFIQWWKIGRQNASALSKIYELSQKSSQIINSYVNFKNLKKEATSIDRNAKINISKMNVNIDTGLNETRTRFNLKVVSGGDKRKEASKNFLSKFTDNIIKAQDENWINISIFVQSLTYKGNEIKDFLEGFRHKLINYAEENFIPGLSLFIKDFVIFKFYPQDYSGIIVFEFKTDVYNLIRSSITDLEFIRDFLTNNSTSTFEFDLKITSSNCLGECINNENTLGEFLRTSEVSINSSGIKSRLRTFLMNLNENYKSYLPLLQLLFAPNNMKLNYKGPVDEFLGSSENESLKYNLSKWKPFLDFIRDNIDSELRNVMSRLEIGFNLYDIFFNLQIFSTHLWQD